MSSDTQPGAETGDEASDRPASSDEDRSAEATFERLRSRVDRVEFDELLTDPEYAEFSEEYGDLEPTEEELWMAEDDVELSDLLEGEPVPDERGDDGEGEEDGSDLVGELLEELESGAASEAQRERLREALGVQRSVAVQLNYLKSRFLDLEAYIRAMEELFEHGEDPLEELRAEVEAVREDVEAQSRRLGGVERTLVAVGRRQQAHERDLGELDRSFAETRREIDRNLAVIERELRANRRFRERHGES